MRCSVARTFTVSLLSPRRYSLQAFRAVNQCVGRCIRHRYCMCRAVVALLRAAALRECRFDFGSIVLLDERFCRPDIRGALSKWVRPRVRDFRTSAEALSSLDAFFAHWEKAPPRAPPPSASFAEADLVRGAAVACHRAATAEAKTAHGDAPPGRLAEADAAPPSAASTGSEPLQQSLPSHTAVAAAADAVASALVPTLCVRCGSVVTRATVVSQQTEKVASFLAEVLAAPVGSLAWATAAPALASTGLMYAGTFAGARLPENAAPALLDQATGTCVVPLACKVRV